VEVDRQVWCVPKVSMSGATMAEGRFQGWQALAAVLGGVAALITAGVAVFAFARDSGGGADDRKADLPTRTAGAGQTTGPIPTTGNAPAAADSPVYQGPLRFAFRIDFDKDPPDVISNLGLEDLVMVGGNHEKVVVDQGAAVWSGATPPTRAQCAQTISTSGTTSAFPVDIGMQICFKSRNGRIGHLKFLNHTSDLWSVDAIVWPAG
jgi:hypothetical protein